MLVCSGSATSRKTKKKKKYSSSGESNFSRKFYEKNKLAFVVIGFHRNIWEEELFFGFDHSFLCIHVGCSAVDRRFFFDFLH